MYVLLKRKICLWFANQTDNKIDIKDKKTDIMTVDI